MAIPTLKDFFQQQKAATPTITMAPDVQQPEVKMVQPKSGSVIAPTFIGPIRPVAPTAANSMPAAIKPQADNLGLQPDVGTSDNLQPASTPTSLKQFATTKLGPVTGVDGTPSPTLTPAQQRAKDIADFTNKSTSQLLKEQYGNTWKTKIGGFFLDLVDPVSKTLSTTRIANSIQNDVANGKIDPKVYDMMNDLHKSGLQVLGDAAQVGLLMLPVMTAEAATVQGSKMIAEQGLKTALLNLGKIGLKEGAAQGLSFGVAQALSSGSTDPKELAKIIGINIGGGALLGGVATPALGLAGYGSKKVITAVSKVVSETNKIQNELVDKLVASGMSRQEAENMSRQGGWFGNIFDTPQVKEMRDQLQRSENLKQDAIRDGKKSLVQRYEKNIQDLNKKIKAKMEGGYVDLSGKGGEPDVPVTKTIENTDGVPVKNDFYNMEKLDVSPEAKAALSKEIDSSKEEVQKIIGKKIQHQEFLDLANKVSRSTEKTFGRQEQLEFLAKSHNAQAQLADVGERMAKGEVTQEEFLSAFKEAKSVKTFGGRLLDSFKESAQASPAEKPVIQKILDQMEKQGADVDKIFEEAKKVNFDDPEEVISFYRSHIKTTKEDWLNLIRMSSMLSSPNTHLVNLSGNFQGTGVLRPLTLEVQAAMDPVRAALTGQDRRYFMGEGAAYAKGYYSNIKAGFQNMVQAIKGVSTLSETGSEYVRMPLTTAGTKARIAENALSVFPRLLEGVDQFFSTLSEGGTTAQLTYKKASGGAVGDITKAAKLTAAKDLMRSALENPDQGNILKLMDYIPARIQEAKGSNNGLVRTIANFSFPFVRFAANAFKTGLEYSPAGITTLWGATNKQEQLAKFAIGMATTAATAVLVANDRITGGGPTNEKMKQAWAESGRKPWSIKVGNKWISYQRLHPALAFNFAFVSAVKQGLDEQKLTGDEGQTALGVFGNTMGFIADQTYLKNVGDFVSAAQGDSTALAKFFGNYPAQILPYRAMLSWVERLTDPVQRKIDPNGTFLAKQLQAIEKQIPGLSGNVPTINDASGNPLPAKDRALNAFSPVGVSTANPQGEQQVQDLENLSDLGKQEKITSDAETQKAQDLLNEFKNMAPEQRRSALQDKIKSGEITETTVDKMVGIVQKQGSGDIAAELSGRSNAVKAKFIKQKLDGMQPQERKAYMLQLQDQGILTADLADALATELQK